MSDPRRRPGGHLIKLGLEGLASVASLHPQARPEVHAVERLRDVRYGPDRDHVLDVWRPVETGPHPCVLYIHGGGFSILSKDTHWVMALALARRGYVVCTINYRLAPKHRFPAAIEDSCRAWLWMLDEVERFGGDAARCVVAGESAGANLATSVAIASCWPQALSSWTQDVYDRGRSPDAVIAACGMFQVSDPPHLWRHRASFPGWLKERVVEISQGYLPREPLDEALLDPIIFLENQDISTSKKLPPFFLPVGTRDPLLPDTRRMSVALDALGVVHDTRYYPGEVHAFHAFVWREQAKQCWRDTFAFLKVHVPGSRMTVI